MVKQLQEKNNDITNFSFLKSDFPIANAEASSFVTHKKTQELSSYKLLRCAKYILSKHLNKTNPKIVNCTIENSSNIFKELYKRFLIPFYILILSLTPFILIFLSKENSKYLKLKISTFLIGLFIIIFSETTIRLISDSIIRNLTISLLPFLFVVILYSIFFKKFYHYYLN
jgi:lipopolysaccharide export system permease protein